MLGWLTDLTNWLKEQFEQIWSDFKEFMGDLLLDLVQIAFDVTYEIANLLPELEFLETYSICALLSAAGPQVAWLYGELDINRCMLALASGYGFRLARKVVTLFQW